MDEPGWTASYIEATRTYGPGCCRATSGAGSRRCSPAGFTPTTRDPTKTRSQIVARATYCDRNGVKYMLPFGRIHVGGQLYWVYQFSSFGDEWYEVARMTPLKMGFAVESYGGGTRGCASQRARTLAALCMVTLPCRPRRRCLDPPARSAAPDLCESLFTAAVTVAARHPDR